MRFRITFGPAFDSQRTNRSTLALIGDQISLESEDEMEGEQQHCHSWRGRSLASKMNRQVR
jgi:hypothetical protein